jgi:hypothetical protein
MNDEYVQLIINELGGAFGAKPVSNFCAPNGICYGVRDACVRLDDAGWVILGRMLSKDQYAKAREMRDMSGEEFKRRTDEYVSKTSMGEDTAKFVDSVVGVYVH